MKRKFLAVVCLVLFAAVFALSAAACNNKRTPAVYTLDPDRDFGIYWYNDEGERMLSEADMPVGYYDPAKPTVIYSHGWKADLSAEALVTQPSTREALGELCGYRDYAAELRAAGYNVGYFDWHLYAADLFALQDEIWTVETEIPEDGSNYAAALKALGGHTFAGEFAREIATVMKDAENPSLHFVGHSFGGQMVIAAAYTLAMMYDEGLVVNPNCLPDRLSLADPYIPVAQLEGEIDVTGKTLNAALCTVNADAFALLNKKGTFIDLYGAMNFIYEQYYILDDDIGTGAKAHEVILDNCAYVVLSGLNKLGSAATQHVNARDYVLTNLVDGVAGEKGGLPFSVACSAEEGRQYVGVSYTQLGPGFDWEETYYEVT